LAIIVWWQLDSPLLEVLMVSLIAALGYFPTFRKTFIDPSNETVTFWVCMVATDILALQANSEHNALTMSYVITLDICNSAVVVIILSRKKMVNL